jgi:6,7-dimethyl-8-ribityllumazine synthase
MIGRTLFSIALSLTASSTSAFVPSCSNNHALSNNNAVALKMAAESEVSFSDDLDGSAIRIGVLRTRWNDEHVSNLVDGIKAGAKGCKVEEENIFIKEVPGAYELPYAAKLLAMSGTVDAIICCGVLIKGDTFHFEYISDAVSSGIMNVNLSTMTPVIYGVLNCLDEEQVKKRSSNADGGHNHGEDWGKTAVEMAIMRKEATGKGAKGSEVKVTKELAAMGFGKSGGGEEKQKPGFF